MQQHLPQNFSTTFSFHLNSFPSFPLVQPPTQVVLHHAKWAQQSQLYWHQPTQHSIGLTSSTPTICKPSQILSWPGLPALLHQQDGKYSPTHCSSNFDRIKTLSEKSFPFFCTKTELLEGRSKCQDNAQQKHLWQRQTQV